MKKTTIKNLLKLFGMLIGLLLMGYVIYTFNIV